MKPILIVKNYTEDEPGVIEDVLKERSVPYQIVDLGSGVEFPEVAGFGAVIVLGSGESANEQTPKMEQKILRIREVLQLHIPYLGICFGFQALVKAAGGKVIKSLLREIGFRDPNGDFFTVNLTKDALTDPIFEGFSPSFVVFQWHEETVELTDESQLLAVGKFCRNQAAKIAEKVYGFQSHFEMTEKIVADWIKSGIELEEIGADNLASDFAAVKNEYLAVGRKLTENFLKIAGY